MKYTYMIYVKLLCQNNVNQICFFVADFRSVVQFKDAHTSPPPIALRSCGMNQIYMQTVAQKLLVYIF